MQAAITWSQIAIGMARMSYINFKANSLGCDRTAISLKKQYTDK